MEKGSNDVMQFIDEYLEQGRENEKTIAGNEIKAELDCFQACCLEYCWDCSCCRCCYWIS